MHFCDLTGSAHTPNPCNFLRPNQPPSSIPSTSAIYQPIRSWIPQPLFQCSEIVGESWFETASCGVRLVGGGAVRSKLTWRKLRASWNKPKGRYESESQLARSRFLMRVEVQQHFLPLPSPSSLHTCLKRGGRGQKAGLTHSLWHDTPSFYPSSPPSFLSSSLSCSSAIQQLARGWRGEVLGSLYAFVPPSLSFLNPPDSCLVCPSPFLDWYTPFLSENSFSSPFFLLHSSFPCYPNHKG